MPDLEAIELVRVELPLKRPFKTSFGVETHRDAILVHAIARDAHGWGECVAMSRPLYSGEWGDAAWLLLRDSLVPAVLRAGDEAGLEPFRGNPMARAAIRTALLDLRLRREGKRLKESLGGSRERIECGVSIGIAPGIDALLGEIAGYLEQGYRRVKLKIEPGRDVAVARAAREAFPDAALMVDANAAYTLADAGHLAALDELGLLMIEQPLSEDDLVDHATLQGRLETALCLDESIPHAGAARAAIALGACRVINIKPGRVGGLEEAGRIHDLAREAGLPVWCGGMLETGIGRAANLALASLPGFTLPGDTSASDRYFEEDITEPFVLAPDGTLGVPTGPGIGVDPAPDRLVRFATDSLVLKG